jgi:leader peptidase (prepilin peptidase)/N-methyltransferase
MTGPWIIGCAAAGLAAGPVLRAVIVQFSIRPGSEREPHCAACHAAVLPAPRVSLSLAGRCPRCRDRIGPPRLLIEAVAAGCLVLIAARSTAGWELAALGWLTIVAIPLTFIDIAVRRLPDLLTVTAYAGTVALLAAAALSAGQPSRLGRAVLAGLVLTAAYLILFMASPASIGLGDAKLAASVGTALGWLGWRAVIAGTFTGLLAAGIYGVCLLVLRRAGLRDMIAFGPFLALGALIAIVL